MSPEAMPPPEPPDPYNTCFDCGEPTAVEWTDHRFTYGAGDSAVELRARIPVDVCRACGAKSVGHEAEILMGEAIFQHHGVLTPREIRGVREGHGLNRAAFAALTGLGEATLHRWENGIVVQNRANDRYLRLLRSPDVVDRLRRIAAGPVEREWTKPKFRNIDEGAHREAQKAFPLRRAA